MKDAQATGEAFSPQREHPALQNMKILYFFLFFGSFCPPRSGSGSIQQFKLMRIRNPVVYTGVNIYIPVARRRLVAPAPVPNIDDSLSSCSWLTASSAM